MSEDWGSCQNCGRLLWEDGGPGYDDVVSQPYVTESGDVYCIPCGRAADEADREVDPEFAEFDPYDQALP